MCIDCATCSCWSKMFLGFSLNCASGPILSCLSTLCFWHVFLSHIGCSASKPGYICVCARACLHDAKVVSSPFGWDGSVKGDSVVYVCVHVLESDMRVPWYDRWCLLWVNAESFAIFSPFIAIHICHVEIWACSKPVKLQSPQCIVCFDFDEEMFFAKVALGVAFDVCFQYASCEAVMRNPPTRQWKVLSDEIVVWGSVCVCLFLCQQV